MTGKYISYQKETKFVPFGGRTIVVEHLTPVFTPEQRTKRKLEIEQQLFEIFEKYQTAN